jgi:hypothetical protein
MLLAAVVIGVSVFESEPEIGYTSEGYDFYVNTVNLFVSEDVPDLLLEQTRIDGYAVTGFSELDLITEELGIVNVTAFYPGIMRTPELKAITDRWYTLTLDAHTYEQKGDALLISDMLSELSWVDEAYPAYIKHSMIHDEPMRGGIDYTPNDTFWSLQWGLPVIYANDAWDYVTPTSETIIGITDTGVQWAHEDLWPTAGANPGEDLNSNGYFDLGDINDIDDDGNGFVDDVVGWDFVSNDNDPTEHASIHGTHVCGCATAGTNNNQGIAGTSQGWFIATCHANSSGSLVSDPFLGFMYFSDIGIPIANASWGSYGYSSAEQTFINASATLLIAAAGNDDITNVMYPAGYNNVISVGAIDNSYSKAWFSNYGSSLDVVAPGVYIASTWMPDTYSYSDGTSMASPIVAGVAALVYWADPSLTRKEIALAIINTADSDIIYSNNPGYPYPQLGEGLVNALAAVQSATPIADTYDTTLQCFSLDIGANPVISQLSTLSYELFDAGEVRLEIVDLSGRIVALLENGRQPMGEYTVSWNTGVLPAGMYIVKLTASGSVATEKITIIR